MVLPAYALRMGPGATILVLALATKGSLYPSELDPCFRRSGGDTRLVTLDGGNREMSRQIGTRWRPGDVILTTLLTRAALVAEVGVHEARRVGG